MKNQISKLGNLRGQLGQGMTEYIIIVALIAVAAIGVYQMFGETVQSQTAAIAAELGGGDGTESNARAGRAGTAAVDNADADTNLSNYASSNNATVGD